MYPLYIPIYPLYIYTVYIYIYIKKLPINRPGGRYVIS